MKKYVWQLGLAALLLGFSGCASADPEPEEKPAVSPKKNGFVRESRKVDGSEVDFSQIGNTRLTAGAPAVIGVQLFNRGAKELAVSEWYMQDGNNFAVHYRRVPADRPAAGAPWLKYVPKVPPKARRIELILKPRTRAQFLVELPFIGELSPGERADFELYVTTALTTFHVKTPVFTVTTE